MSAGSSGASIGIGAGRFTDKTTESAETNAVSTIGAGGNITLAAGNTFNDQAGQIAAGGAVTILGTNGVNILSGNDVTNFDEVATNFFAGVSLGVSSSMVGAGQSIENLASKLGNVTDGYSAANVGFAGLKAYDALSSLKDGLAAGNLASISLTAGFTYSKTETELSSSTPVLPTISGNSVSIISTNGDFTSRGLQVSATADAAHAADPMNGDVLISANTIDMAGAEATNTASSSSQSAGASIGVSVGVGLGGATGITPTASVSAGQSKSSSASTTQVMSTVSATNNITFASNGDTTLNNTIFSAGTIDGTVGGNLDIVSTPSTGTSANSSQSLGFSFTGGTIGRSADGSPLLTSGNAGTALGGLTLGGVQPGFGSGKGSSNWIDTPAGLYSDGATNIYVAGNTNLAAAGIISSTGQVNLDTGTLTWSDFAGSKEYKAYEVDANIDLFSGKDANGQSKNTSSVEGKYQLDDERQSVKATVNGNITVRNGDQQAALEQSGATKPVDQINKDPTQQSVITRDRHIDLEPYLSAQSLQAAVAAGQAIAQALGQALDKMFADGALAQSDRRGVATVLAHWNDPSILNQLASCGGSHAENEHSFFDWIITPAHAEVEGCTFVYNGLSYYVSKDAAETCVEAIKKAAKAYGVEIADDSSDDEEDGNFQKYKQIGSSPTQSPDPSLDAYGREIGRPGSYATNTESGSWVSVNESMSREAEAYQAQITGSTGRAYVVNGVKFDGVDTDGTLLEAKGPGYAKFVDSATGEFKDWFNGSTTLLGQAQRLTMAAGDTPIVWKVAEPSAATAIQNLLSSRFPNITVKVELPN